MSRLSPLRDLGARLADGGTFGVINALQLRGRAGFHTRDEFEAYVGRYENASLEEYYAVPPDAAVELPGEGSLRAPSPWPSGCQPNDTMHCDIWLGPDGWRSPTMFMMHGVMSVSDVGYKLMAQWLNRRGWSAIFFHLPYHYGRRPPGTLSGEMALSANLIRSAEGIRQAVIELRLVAQALRERGSPHIGLWACSYGGWVGSLLALLEPAVSTVWLLEPIADVDYVTWESAAAVVIRRQLRRRGIDRELLQRHLRLVCPSHHQPVVDPERILLLAGLYDRIAPVKVVRRLHEQWPGSHYREVRQGHVGYQLWTHSRQLACELWPELFTIVK